MGYTETAMLSLLVGFILATVVANVKNTRDRDKAMMADYQTRYDYWLADCEAQPWRYEPPVRPTCEDMTAILMEQISSPSQPHKKI